MSFQMTGAPGPWRRKASSIRNYEWMIERGRAEAPVPDFYYNDPRPNDFRNRDKITAMVEGLSRPITFRVEMIGEGWDSFPVAWFTKDGIRYYIGLPDGYSRQQPVARDTVWRVISSRPSYRKKTKRLTKEEREWYDRQVFNWVRSYGLKRVERYNRALAEHKKAQEEDYNWWREESWKKQKRYYEADITAGDAFLDIYGNESGNPVYFGRYAQQMGVDLEDLSEAAQGLAKDDYMGKTSRNALTAALKRLAKKGALGTMLGETSRGRETTAYYYGPTDNYWAEYYPDQVVALAAYEGAE